MGPIHSRADKRLAKAEPELVRGAGAAVAWPA